MARILALSVALSLALLGIVVASWGTSPDAFILRRVTPAVQAVLAPLPSRPQGSAEPLRRAAAPPLSNRRLRPSSHPIPVAARPPVRPYIAEGPLAQRVMDPTFGPELRPSDLLVPDPPGRLAGASDLLCIAVAIYHEARGESLDGQLAVASVILNRTKEPARWGATPCEVVVPVQFSFMASDGSYPAIPKNEAWAIAVEMAREALERGPSPLVGDADHYHTPGVDPDWDQDMDQVVQIQDHIFFVDPLSKG